MTNEMSTHEEFRSYLNNERDILSRYSEAWTSFMAANEAMPELVREQARSAVGKASLLLRKKLRHFEELLDQAENKTATKDISINDLLGYWELMESQINEVKSLFQDIEKYREGGGNEVNATEEPPGT